MSPHFEKISSLLDWKLVTDQCSEMKLFDLPLKVFSHSLQVICRVFLSNQDRRKLQFLQIPFKVGTR
jgi:hypothetical protein